MTEIHSFARLTAGVAAALVAATLAGPAFAQAQPAKPAGAPAAAPGAAPAGAQDDPQAQFSASPWQKICQEIPKADNNPQGGKKVCVTSQILGVEKQAIAKVDIIELEGEAKKRLNIAVPLGMRLQPGVRLTLDKDPVPAPFVICQPLPGGGATCVAEAEVNADFIAKFKKAKAVYLQMVNGTGRTLSLPMSNTDFAKANDGPGVDAKVAMEQERKRMEEARAAAQKQEEEGKAALLKKGQELERAKTGK